MAEKSKILLIGGTGYIGKFIVEASAKSGHPTSLLVRESTLSNPSKSSMLDSFKNLGVTFITGDLFDHESLVRAVKQVDVVISTVGPPQFGDQVKIIAAIKEAGNVKEHDIATYTIKSIDDPRTLNKIVFVKPPCNIYSFHELVSLWEKKIGKTLERVYLSADQVSKNLEDAPTLLKKNLSIWHSVFVKGDQTNFEIEPSFGVEASMLYPEVKCTRIDEYLNHVV